MKKFTALILCAMLNSLALFAQTNISGNISANATWTSAGSPYIITNSIEVSPGITLTVQSGVTVKFNAGVYLHVRGTMNASSATFTANGSTAKGFYDGIYVSYEYYETGNVNLTNCTVEYASNLYVRKGQLTLNSCIINNLSGTIRVSNLGTLNIDKTKISNTNFPITYYGSGMINPGTNLEFTNNTYNYVDIDFSEVNELFWLKNFGYPYYNDNSIQVRSAGTLKIDPGVDLQIANTEIQVYGKIKAVGTKTNPIKFDKTPGSSYWLGINIHNSAIDTACVLRNCIIRNANYNYYEWYNALEIENASPTIDSCRFVGNAYNLHIDGISKPVISNCYLGPSITTAGETFNIVLDMNANPVFVNDSIQFNNTEIRAVGLRAVNVTDDAHLKKLSFIGLNNISYCLYDNSTVLDTASLTIDPGVVIKCRNYNSMIIGNGVITGLGTALEPIIYTHIADDNWGNPSDSQNNGTQTINYSDGGRIALYSTAESRLENWKFNYIGYNSGNWGLYVKNSNVVKNCEIKNTYNGVWFTKSAKVTNNTFVNVPQYPIGYQLSTGTPDISGNTMTNVGYIGIQLDGVDNDSPTLKKMNFAGYTNLPYILTHQITIEPGNVMNIAPGVVLKFHSYWNSGIWVNGALKAIGTKNEKITFTSIRDDSAWGDTNNDGTGSVPGSDDWMGLVFTGTASDTENILRNCEIKYSGDAYNNGYTYAPIGIYDCRVLLDSVKVNFSARCGIGIFGNANPEIKDCAIQNIGWEPFYMDMFANPSFTGNSTLANVADIAIKLRPGVVSGTVPVRSFAGYNPITYVWYDNTLTVNDQLTIPAGLTFKGPGRWEIYGKLNIQGTALNPVVFTTVEDDAFGNPKDSQQNGQGSNNANGGYFVFYDASNDSSTIDHAIFRYSTTTPIQLNNASPTIKNCAFENSGQIGISLVGNSAPAIDNCAFNNIAYPFNTSLLTYPKSTTGNTISGTTGRGIRVNDETLTQDATLAKREFGGIGNIPYIFRNYTVGTGAKLTINPGVICKFNDYGYLDVRNGLMAVGGSTVDSVIVFTTDRDDFYGGDTYNNGDANGPWNNAWQGIYFYNEAIDANCVLKNCIVRYASYYNSRSAVNMDNASPTIQNCRFINGYNGIKCNNTSLPVISNCDFSGTDPNSGYAVQNLSTSNTVIATNCWWNSNTGPKHTSNPTGTGERVSDYVSFTPYLTQVVKPELGDVSVNGTINPYDASLILQYLVSNIVLTPKQMGVADVSGNKVVASYDASMILQYNVGLITGFEKSSPLKNAFVADNASVAFSDITLNAGKGTFTVPVLLSTEPGIKAMDMKFTYNPEHIRLVNIDAGKCSSAFSYAQSEKVGDGVIALSMASAYDLNLQQDKLYLEFALKNAQISESTVDLASGFVNETNLATVSPVTINSQKVATGLQSISLAAEPTITVLESAVCIGFGQPESVTNLSVQLTDITGKVIYSTLIKEPAPGVKNVFIPLAAIGAHPQGVYIIRLHSNEISTDKKVLIK